MTNTSFYAKQFYTRSFEESFRVYQCLPPLTALECVALLLWFRLCVRRYTTLPKVALWDWMRKPVNFYHLDKN